MMSLVNVVLLVDYLSSRIFTCSKTMGTMRGCIMQDFTDIEIIVLLLAYCLGCDGSGEVVLLCPGHGHRLAIAYPRQVLRAS